MHTKLIVYGHVFCGQAVHLRSALDQNVVVYEWRDIAHGDPRYRDELRALARGFLSVPTVVFPDGQVMVEPYPREVLARLRSTVVS
jgi:mycoredoxin